MHNAKDGKSNERASADRQAIEVADLTLSDVSDIVQRGIADLKAAPVVSVGIASIYTLGGWLLAVLLAVLDLPYLVYPLAMGFTLVVSGEHYVFDVLVGWAYVAAVMLLWRRLDGTIRVRTWLDR